MGQTTIKTNCTAKTLAKAPTAKATRPMVATMIEVGRINLPLTFEIYST